MLCPATLYPRNRLRIVCALGLLLVLISGCGGPTPTPTPTPHPSTWPTWTFMVFVNGDNNLHDAAIDDFGEMAQVGSNDTLNIVVQLDLYGNGGTNRYLVGKNDTVDSAPVQTLSEQNMGDPHVLEDFIVWAVDNYETDHYILVIWDHGDGWRLERQKIAELEAAQRAEGAAAAPGMKAVSHDEYDGDVLYMHEVGQALAQARDSTDVRLDIVGFDACFMGMIEVAYEIRDSADFMVGSEDTEPGDGWPYDTILKDMDDLSESRIPENLAKIIVRRYGEFYGSNGDETQAAYDLRQLSRVTDAISYFVQTHNGLPEDDKEWPGIGDARPEIEEFHDNCAWCCPDQCWGVAIGDFAKEVGTRIENDDIQALGIAACHRHQSHRTRICDRKLPWRRSSRCVRRCVLLSTRP
jgi:hypothetical protein